MLELVNFTRPLTIPAKMSLSLVLKCMHAVAIIDSHVGLMALLFAFVQLRFKDDTIVAYMRKVKKLKEMNSASANSKDTTYK